MAAPGPVGAVMVEGALLEIPAAASGFRFKAKLEVEVEVVVAVDVAMAAAAAAPGAFKLKLSVPAPDVPAVLAGVPKESPVLVDEVGVVASEAKSVGPALVVAAVGVGAAGCVAPTPVAAGVAGVKDNPANVVGWAEVPIEPILKLEVPPLWDVLPPVNEKPPGVVDGAAEVVVEPNTKPVGPEPWLEVTVLEMALVRVLLPSPKPPGCAGAGVAAVLLKFSFGALSPKENPVPPAAGVVLPKLNPGVCVAGAWVVIENRLVEGVLTGGWEGFPKLNPPVLDVEKENPVAGVVVAVFAVPNVNPPVGAPVPPKLNPLMAPDSRGSSYSGSQSKSVSVCNRACALRSCLLYSAEAAAASPFHSHGVLHFHLGACLRPTEQPPEPPLSWCSFLHCHSFPAPVLQPCHSWPPWGWSWTGPCSQLVG